MAQRRQRAPRKERKSERLELRVTPSPRRVIERAIGISGLAAGDLAYEGARRVLADHALALITGADREVFVAGVKRPPQPARRLVAALAAHRKLGA